MKNRWMLILLAGGLCYATRAAVAAPQYTITLTEAVPAGIPGQFSYNTIASAISPTGVTVGLAGFNPDEPFISTRAVAWAANGAQPVILPVPQSSSYLGGGLASAINASGMMAGSLTLNSATSGIGDRAVRWDASPAHHAVELDHLGVGADGATMAAARGINDFGVAVGQASKYDTSGASLGIRAVRWNANTSSATELATLGADTSDTTNAIAHDINDKDDIVGMAQKYSPDGDYLGARAVRWDSAGVIHELDIVTQHPTGFASAEARAINDAGTIVGFGRKYFGTVSQGTRAIRWDAATGQATPLDPLGPPGPGSVMNVQALAIDAVGNIVGSSEGTYFEENGAVIWPAGQTQPLKLSSLLVGGDNGMELTAATGINDAGQIVGYMRTGSPSQIRYQGFLLTPVPEPTLIIANALLLIGFRRCRRVPTHRTTARTAVPG